MRTGPERRLHLGYCTSIHPASGWGATFAELRRHAPAVKARVSPEAPFGLGLRLSGAESVDLLRGGALTELRDWLDAEGLYVFTLNAFPHGTFHGEPVKDRVHAPDWHDDERVAYTLRMAEVLAGLLPAGGAGSISTSPLSYAPWYGSGAPDWEVLTQNLVRVAEGLAQVGERTGKRLCLAIEPEADGLLGDCTDLAAFFEQRLLPAGPEDLLREHVRACFDVCHAAVAFERPREAVRRLHDAGMRIGKVQLSSALAADVRALNAEGDPSGALHEFTASPYLHQVVVQGEGGATTAFADLPEALASGSAGQWRVHCHVPVFVEDYGGLRSTQDLLRETLQLLREDPFCEHLEIETYTWDVLPQALRRDVVDSIVREVEWVLRELG